MALPLEAAIMIQLSPTVITNVTISGHLDSSLPEDSDHYIIIQIELWLGESRGEILLFCRYVCRWCAQYIYIKTVKPNCSLALVHLIPSWLVWAEMKCTVHVVLP